ncbi:glycosyltransferase family 4 protein [Rubripirellula amarantea]|nr:glycosyltransferase family 4 protein [Rubripirellula amarantea]
MHICIVTEDFLPNIGGMSQHVYEIARCFVRSGINVTVINQVVEDRAEGIEDYEGIRVVRSSFESLSPKTRIIPYCMKLRRLILQEHDRLSIDVIHWHDLRAGLAIKYLPFDCPKVFTNHSSTFLMRKSSRAYRSYYRFSLNHADHFLAPSQELAEETDKLLACTTTYIPNGYDPSRFYPQHADGLRAELGIAETDQVLLVPRRLAPKNGVFVLAQAMPRILAAHPNARAVITGGGFPEERGRIEELASTHNYVDRINFLDGVENQYMPRHYNMADLVVMPSFMEAVSLSALEAMGCGKCVVASDVGGLSQLFKGEQWGKLVPPGAPDDLADAIIELLGNDSKRSELANAGREHVLENYTWEQVANQTLRSYKVA